MNYASLDEIYDTQTLQVRKNNYNEVMKNLTQKNFKGIIKTEKKKTNKIK